MLQSADDAMHYDLLSSLTDSIDFLDAESFLGTNPLTIYDANFDDNIAQNNILPCANSDDFLTVINNNDCKGNIYESTKKEINVHFKQGYNYNNIVQNQPTPSTDSFVNLAFSTPFILGQDTSNCAAAKGRKTIVSSEKSMIGVSSAMGKSLCIRPKFVLPKTRVVYPNDTTNETNKKGDSTSIIGRAVSDKLLKRHNRMIKNRESANLSRKRKRDYVLALENRVSELLNENVSLKNENESLKAQIKGLNNTNTYPYHEQSVNIKSFNRKNTAVLLAMVLMISFNFGSFDIFLTKSKLNTNESKFVKLQNGRHLLWIQNTSSEKNNKYPNINKSKDEIFPMCPVPINQTENIRLATEIRKWIADNRFGNHSSQNESFSYKIFKQGKRTKRLQTRSLTNKILKAKQEENFAKIRWGNKVKGQRTHIFDVKRKDQFSGLLKKINRQADTFYVFAFNADHLLLPTDVHNKIMRPKMSFVLPASNVVIGKLTSLMQIDCVVMNTSAIQLEDSDNSYHLKNMSRRVPPAGRKQMESTERLIHQSEDEANNISINSFVLHKDNNDILNLLPSYG